MSGMVLNRCALTIGAASVLLAGCGGSQPQITIPQTSKARTDIERDGSSGSGYMYVYTRPYGIEVRTFPAGKHVRSLYYSGWPCADPNTGNVYVSSGNVSLTEYTPGAAKVIATTTFPTGYYLGQCAVDPTTGSVAVAGWKQLGGTRTMGIVLVYATLDDSPVIYSDPASSQYFFPGYDPQGDLFLANYYLLGELPKGQETFAHFQVHLPKHYRFDGPIQWDGTYMTAESAYRHPAVFRFTVAGSSLTIVGKTAFGRQSGSTNTCITGNTVIAPYGTHVEHRRAAYWHYPNAGKQPYEVLKGFNPIFVAVGISGK